MSDNEQNENQIYQQPLVQYIPESNVEDTVIASTIIGFSTGIGVGFALGLLTGITSDIVKNTGLFIFDIVRNKSQ